MSTRFQNMVVAWFFLSGGCFAAELGLTAQLKDARVVGGECPSIEVAFLLKNESAAVVALPERWNSWGAFQWRFTIKDANNKTYQLGNPQTDWFANYLTIFTIEPEKTHLLRCRLLQSAAISNSPEDKDISLFYIDKIEMHEAANWVFPLKISGHFAAKLAAMGDHRSNWEGEIDTATLTVTSNTEPSAPPKGPAVLRTSGP